MLTTVQSTYDRTSVTSYADESITGPFPVFIYCAGVIYSAILKIISSCKKTAIVYVQ